MDGQMDGDGLKQEDQLGREAEERNTGRIAKINSRVVQKHSRSFL